MRARIAELEIQQVECEEKLAAMVIQAQEYAARLEQAQDTIHSLSEPKLLDEDDFPSMNQHSGFNSFSVSSQDGTKETEITKVELKLTGSFYFLTKKFLYIIRGQYFLQNSDKKCKRKLNAT